MARTCLVLPTRGQDGCRHRIRAVQNLVVRAEGASGAGRLLGDPGECRAQKGFKGTITSTSNALESAGRGLAVDGDHPRRSDRGVRMPHERHRKRERGGNGRSAVIASATVKGGQLDVASQMTPMEMAAFVPKNPDARGERRRADSPKLVCKLAKKAVRGQGDFEIDGAARQGHRPEVWRSLRTTKTPRVQDRSRQ